VPGLPSGSLVAIAVIASSIGLPSEATAILLVSDRMLEMARTGVNVLGDTVCATMVARLEGEDGVLGTEPAREV
jgi:Na+/H+-dicarboxylate symporter